MIQGRDETATDISMPVGEKDVQQLLTQLSANDVEQFYAAFQLTMKRQQMEQLTHEIEQARQRVVDNEAKMLSVALPLIALASLVELQASGVEDIDLLDRMLERGEEWLDQTMQNLQRCKQLNMLDEGITLWCEHALDGAYDWIASMSEQEGLENSLDQPGDEPALVTIPSENNTTTEDQLLRKLMSDDDEEQVASTTTEQTPPQSEQSEQPEQDEAIETPEAAIDSEETEISEPEAPEEAIESEEALEAEAAEILEPQALEEVSETEEAELPEPEALIPEEEVLQAEEADKQEYDFAIQQAPVQETLPDEPAAEALPALVATTDETAEVSTEEPESPQQTDEQAEAEQEPQEIQEPHDTIAEQPVVLPEEEIKKSEVTKEPVNTEEPEVAEEPEAAEEPTNTEETPNIEEPETAEEPMNVVEPAVTATAANGEATAEEWPYIYPEVLVVEDEPRLYAEAEQPVISNQPAAVEAETPPHRSDSTQSQQTTQPSAVGSCQPQPIQPGHAQEAPDNKKPHSRWQHSLAKLLGR